MNKTNEIWKYLIFENELSLIVPKHFYIFHYSSEFALIPYLLVRVCKARAIRSIRLLQRWGLFVWAIYLLGSAFCSVFRTHILLHTSITKWWSNNVLRNRLVCTCDIRNSSCYFTSLWRVCSYCNSQTQVRKTGIAGWGRHSAHDNERIWKNVSHTYGPLVVLQTIHCKHKQSIIELSVHKGIIIWWYSKPNTHEYHGLFIQQTFNLKIRPEMLNTRSPVLTIECCCNQPLLFTQTY